MLTVLLAVLVWCAASVVVAGLLAAVMAGARQGEARNRPAFRTDDLLFDLAGDLAGLVPTSRAAPTGATVAA